MTAGKFDGKLVPPKTPTGLGCNFGKMIKGVCNLVLVSNSNISLLPIARESRTEEVI